MIRICLLSFIGVLILSLTNLICYLCQKYKEGQLADANTIKLDKKDVLLIWQTTYTETSESLRDYAKNLVLVNIAALAAATVLLGITNVAPDAQRSLKAACAIFALNLIFSLLAGAAIAEKRKKDLNSLHSAISNAKLTDINISHIWPDRLHFIFTLLPVFLLGAGIFALAKGVLFTGT